MAFFSFGKPKPKSCSGMIQNCYSLTEIPGKKISKSFGLVYFTQKDLNENILDLTPSLFLGLQEAAKKIGANAVINVKLNSGSYGDGNKFGMRVDSYVIAIGEAVSLIDC